MVCAVQHVQYDALVLAAAMAACQDNDKVQVNRIRAIGNLLAIQQLPSAVFTASHVTNSCSQWWGEAWLDQGISCLHTSLASSTEKVPCLYLTCLLRSQRLLQLVSSTVCRRIRRCMSMCCSSVAAQLLHFDVADHLLQCELSANGPTVEVVRFPKPGAFDSQTDLTLMAFFGEKDSCCTAGSVECMLCHRQSSQK